MVKYRTQYGETVPFTQLGGHPSQSKGFNLPSASHMSSGITEEFKEVFFILNTQTGCA